MTKTYLTAALLILLGRTVSAQQMSFGSCRIFGQVFGIDPLGGDMLVKNPSGDIGGLQFDRKTIFERASLNPGAAPPARITAAEVNDGDVICAAAAEERESVMMAGSEVLVASRAEIQAQQKANLIEWSKSGAWGSVAKVNPGTFTLERILPGGSKESLLVEMSPSTRLRRYPAGFAKLVDAAVAPRTQIHIGDELYVRGDSSADGASIKARLILLDGVQALTATIDSIDALGETVVLHELGGGKPINVRIPPSDLFLLNPGVDVAQNEISESPRGRKLQTLDFGDLQAGDSVVVIGKLDESSRSMSAVALIADFGEVAAKQRAGQASWRLGAMKLDLP
jgi:hypothetical protein